MFDAIDDISDIINTYDPCHLLDEGCPIDEYVPEAHLIYATWGDGLSFEVFHDKVYFIFKDQFGDTLQHDSSYFIPMAKDLWSYMKRNENVT